MRACVYVCVCLFVCLFVLVLFKNMNRVHGYRLNRNTYRETLMNWLDQSCLNVFLQFFPFCYKLSKGENHVYYGSMQCILKRYTAVMMLNMA